MNEFNLLFVASYLAICALLGIALKVMPPSSTTKRLRVASALVVIATAVGVALP